MISLLLIKKLSELFLIMLSGFLLVKLNLLKSKDSKTLSVISIYLITPCIILHAFQAEYNKETGKGLLLAFVVAIIVHIILLLLEKIIQKFFKFNEVERCSILYSNSGNLIIPLVVAILGQEWVIYSSAFSSVQLVIMWTHGKSLLSQQKDSSIKYIFKNINFISVIIGIFFFLAQIKFPVLIDNTFSSIGGTIGPVSMIITGMLIGNTNLKRIFSYKKIHYVVFLKMIFFPLVSLLFLKFSGLANLVPSGKMILLITLLAIIAPSASTIVAMAQVYDKDAEYASIIGVTTTLFCILTMPIIVVLYQL